MQGYQPQQAREQRLTFNKETAHVHCGYQNTLSFKHFLQAGIGFRQSFLQAQEVNALRTLDGQAEGTVPDELDERAQSTADTEGDGVVEGLLESVVVEENTRRGVNIGVGVLGLVSLAQVAWKRPRQLFTFPCSVRTPGAISEFFLTNWKTGLARTSGRVAAKSMRASKRGSGLRRTPWP